jgi:Cu/Ag efflux pump CusA
MLAAVMQEGWDGLALGKALEDRAAAIAQTLPLGMTLDKVTDQAVNITAAIDEFMMKFAMALGVVLLVSLLSLGWRVGIVVAAAVPLTLAVVFLIMLETGRFFDRITLGALILALGLLVDDAIIAIEVMVVKMEEGHGPHRSGGLRLEPHGGADAVRDTHDDRRVSASGLRARSLVRRLSNGGSVPAAHARRRCRGDLDRPWPALVACFSNICTIETCRTW